MFTIEEYHDWAPAITRIWDTLGYNGTPRVQGFLRVKPERLENLRSDERTLERTLFGTTPKSPTQADENASNSVSYTESTVEPEQTTTVRDRILRDQTLVAELKSQYDHTCQICGHRLQSANDTGYSEVHHIKPLGDPHNGPDIPENMLVLCPNHHADFDNGMLTVNPDTHTVNHAYDDRVSGTQLTVHDDHQINAAFLEYHNNRIAE
jgi:predicted restriction endonuclease